MTIRLVSAQCFVFFHFSRYPLSFCSKSPSNSILFPGTGESEIQSDLTSVICWSHQPTKHSARRFHHVFINFHLLWWYIRPKDRHSQPHLLLAFYRCNNTMCQTFCHSQLFINSPANKNAYIISISKKHALFFFLPVKHPLYNCLRKKTLKVWFQCNPYDRPPKLGRRRCMSSGIHQWRWPVECEMDLEVRSSQTKKW